MKHVIVGLGLVFSLSACASTPDVMPAPITKPAPAPVIQPAPPVETVDCTGLSEAECQYRIENYGNPNPPPMRGPYDLDPVPVEPVDVEPMRDIIPPSQ